MTLSHQYYHSLTGDVCGYHSYKMIWTVTLTMTYQGYHAWSKPSRLIVWILNNTRWCIGVGVEDIEDAFTHCLFTYRRQYATVSLILLKCVTKDIDGIEAVPSRYTFTWVTAKEKLLATLKQFLWFHHEIPLHVPSKEFVLILCIRDTFTYISERALMLSYVSWNTYQPYKSF